jgi:hypothetical protein
MLASYVISRARSLPEALAGSIIHRLVAVIRLRARPWVWPRGYQFAWGTAVESVPPSTAARPSRSTRSLVDTALLI